MLSVFQKFDIKIIFANRLPQSWCIFQVDESGAWTIFSKVSHQLSLGMHHLLLGQLVHIQADRLVFGTFVFVLFSQGACHLDDEEGLCLVRGSYSAFALLFFVLIFLSFSLIFFLQGCMCVVDIFFICYFQRYLSQRQRPKPFFFKFPYLRNKDLCVPCQRNFSAHSLTRGKSF